MSSPPAITSWRFMNMGTGQRALHRPEPLPTCRRPVARVNLEDAYVDFMPRAPAGGGAPCQASDGSKCHRSSALPDPEIGRLIEGHLSSGCGTCSPVLGADRLIFSRAILLLVAGAVRLFFLVSIVQNRLGEDDVFACLTFQM